MAPTAPTTGQLEDAAGLGRQRDALQEKIAKKAAEFDRKIADLEAKRAEAVRDLEKERDALDKKIASVLGLSVTTTRRSTTKSNGTRARRGDNPQKIIAALKDKPGSSPAEIADATGIAMPVVYTTLSKLSKAGTIKSESAGGRRKAYKVA